MFVTIEIKDQQVEVVNDVIHFSISGEVLRLYGARATHEIKLSDIKRVLGTTTGKAPRGPSDQLLAQLQADLDGEVR